MQPATENPFVNTTVARLMMSRMEVTHEECGIAVISGPWGIGKTTAIDAFASRYEAQCAVVKVEPAALKKGATIGNIMQRVVDTLRALNGRSQGSSLSNATWTLRKMVRDELAALFDFNRDFMVGARFTFIFDEAQYLSKDAIEALRFWNDHDRTTTPFPVGLIFVGNNEFAMAESLGGESVLSGAVRSRLLFEEALSYAHLNDTDLTLFAQSRGIEEAEALRCFVAYFGQRRVKRDLRAADRLLNRCRKLASGGAITTAIVRDVLG